MVITGANAGLGFETALAFARSGASVVMACRSLERAEEAQRDLLERVPAATTTILPLDVSEPESIRAFARELVERGDRLDVLINNAGIVAVPLSRNSVGHEMQLTTNYLGAFALTGLLLPLFRADGSARIVNVGSHANRLGKLPLDAEAKGLVFDTLSDPPSLQDIAGLAAGPEQAVEIYLASRLAIDPDHPAEVAYLEALAGRLGLAPELVAHLESQAAGAG